MQPLRYIVNERGENEAVVIPIEQYKTLSELHAAIQGVAQHVEAMKKILDDVLPLAMIAPEKRSRLESESTHNGEHVGSESAISSSEFDEHCRTNGDKYVFETKGVTAYGVGNAYNFVILEGSEAVGDEDLVDSFPESCRLSRNRLIQNGSLKRNGRSYVFLRNVLFRNMSEPASIIAGNSRSGHTATWKRTNE